MCVCVNCSVVPNSLRPHGLQPTSLLCPWDFPGKDTGVGRHFLLQGIFPTQGLNSGLLHCRQILYWLSNKGSPCKYNYNYNYTYMYIYIYIYIHTHTYMYILSSLSWQLMWKYKHFLIMIFKIKSFGYKVGSLTMKWEGMYWISIITWWDTCPFLLPNIHMLLLVGRKPFCMSLVESHLSFHLSL